MKNQNITQRGTKTTGLNFMISRCPLDSQHAGPDQNPGNVGCFFKYTNEELSNHSNQRHQR